MTTTKQLALPAHKAHVPALDGIRTLAIVPVLLDHMKLVHGGSLGVVVFFVLSGFLIGSLLIDERKRTGTIELRPFYIRRVARLYPALLASMILALVASVIRGEPSLPVMVFSILLALTYTGNIFSSITGQWLPIVNFTWTLAQEEQFYLVAPAFLRRIDMGRLLMWARNLALIALAVAVLRTGVYLIFPEGWKFWYVNPLLNADGMLVGVALALAFNSGSRRIIAVVTRLASTWGAALAIVVIAFCVGVADYETPANSIAISAVCIATVVLIAHFIGHPKSALTSAVAWRPFRWIGQRAYGIYLYHYPIFLLCGVGASTNAGDQAVRVLIALTVTMGITAASYTWLERPAGRWIRTFQQSRRGPKSGRV